MRDSNLGEELDVWRWPSKNYNIVVGDTNAHPPLWNENVPNGNANKHGSAFDDWMASKNS